jgi:Bacteriophage related domain of unknown function
LSQASIFAAIDVQLATLSFPAANIAFLNVTYKPQTNVPYVTSTMAALSRPAITLGRDKRISGGGGYMAEWKGIYAVTAVWPEDGGIDGCSQMMDNILSLFRRGTTLISSDGLQVVFDTPEPMPIRVQNAWARGPVHCPWYCFEAT